MQGIEELSQDEILKMLSKSGDIISEEELVLFDAYRFIINNYKVFIDAIREASVMNKSILEFMNFTCDCGSPNCKKFTRLAWGKITKEIKSGWLILPYNTPFTIIEKFISIPIKKVISISSFAGRYDILRKPMIATKITLDNIEDDSYMIEMITCLKYNSSIFDMSHKLSEEIALSLLNGLIICEQYYYAKKLQVAQRMHNYSNVYWVEKSKKYPELIDLIETNLSEID